ncbi:pyridoxamine 5'-phosphate oxidase family protein [Thermopolyspora sp. NPDC052614]|uniref:pyridoxamine 5'-phosphate oxidase family protein n=1 Tax=Thermopolyspora sp. NPDC052614 TaxID=3155682 RepID=UPI00342E92C1
MTDTMMARRLRELSRQECLRLLGSVPMGRIVFTHQALPAIRPVNHIVDSGDIVIRSHRAAAITAVATRSGVVVAYEADMIDPIEQVGWSVIVTGRAYKVEDPADVARFMELIHPWVSGDMDQVIRVSPEIITGFELVADGSPAAPEMTSGDAHTEPGAHAGS